VNVSVRPQGRHAGRRPIRRHAGQQAAGRLRIKQQRAQRCVDFAAQQ